MRLLRTCSVLAAAAALSALTLTGTAHAQPVTSGTLDMVSQPGDFVGEGKTFHYGTAGGDTFTATSDPYGAVQIQYAPANGDAPGSLAFFPPTGQPFVAGTTYEVLPNNSEPTMRIDAQGRGCGTHPGSFTIEDIALLPDGTLDRFAASFVQHCNGAEPALTGRIVLDVAPPGPPLTVTQNLAATGTVVKKTGVATLTGTVACSKPTFAYVHGTMTEVVNGVTVYGYSQPASVACSPTPTAWTLTITPTLGKFTVGTASLSTTTQATDPETGVLQVTPAGRTVTLVRR